jgi:putative transposase
MNDRKSTLPVTRQCQLLSLSRLTAFYRPKDVFDADLTIMRRIDEMHLERPFYGSRRIRDWLVAGGWWLVAENHDINHKRVQRLMRLMGIMALYPKKGCSRPGKGHKIYLHTNG